jgi:misacylated tRNA(Ala) deacylase
VTLGNGERRIVAAARTDSDGIIWHALEPAAPPPEIGLRASLRVDAARRLALARYHTVLHVLNTVALRDYSGWITGVQIGEDYSRIDFRLDQLTPELCRDLEAKVNAVLDEDRKLEARFLSESEFRERPELLRTLEVRPPVIAGRVRIVEIEGFDTQACGGTHVPTTGAVGRFSIFKVENKGKNNKRLYVRLGPVEA